MPPALVLESSLINRLGLNNGTSENLLQTPKNLGLGPDVSQGPIIAIAIISFIIINHFIQVYVPLPFVVAIGNLQFSKTLRSVTCINCKLYTCLNSSISLKNDCLLTLQYRHNLWLPINLQWPWEEGPMAGLASRLFTKLLQRSK